MRQIPTSYVAIAVLLGIFAFINTVWFRHTGEATAIAITLYILILIDAYFAGRRSRLHNGRPGWTGATLGAMFGLIAGLGSFFIRATSHDVIAPAKGLERLRLVQLANSSTAHIVILLTAMITFGVVSLIMASIGGTQRSEGRGHPDTV